MRKSNPWRSSEQWRLISSAAISAWNAKRKHMPKCGARRKCDGQPCQQLAMRNGKCFLHGGRTPAGSEWHRPRWPDKGAPDAEKKFRRKMRDLERAAKKRSERLARMTPQERERHEQWHAARRPGAAADRERRRQERKQNAEFRATIAKPDRPPSEESAAVREKIDALEVECARLEAEMNEAKGVFG
ncbi:hypothetical protein [Hoeflea sp.]|uniref:hypothetical protein n=1 Tax=Hoeflea sp. TaxID=1940281 RepID=UPI003A914B06